MHPMTSDTHTNTQRNHAAAKNGSGLRRRMRQAYENWQRRRTISALKSVNPHWFKDADIKLKDLEVLVDKVVERDLPTPGAVRPACGDPKSRTSAA